VRSRPISLGIFAGRGGSNHLHRRRRQLAQDLPTKAFQNKHAAVKLFPLSVAIALLVTLLLAPMPRVFATQECDMFGLSAVEASNCHGCCAQMKCCSVPNQAEDSQPVQPRSNNRSDSGSDNILAVVPKFSVLLYALAGDREDYRPSRPASVTPVFSSLARLCIRLI
jgi:hypothetical protein